MIKAIIFDCFGVLYVDSALYFYEKNVPDFINKQDELWAIDRAYDRGEISDKTHAVSVARLTGLSVEQIQAGIRAYHRAHDENISLVKELRTDYKVAMLSNIGRGGMDEFFSPAQRKQLFDEVVLSSDIRVAKPDPKAFLITAEKLGVKTHESVMIDDRQANCTAAEGVGMKSILYKSSPQLRKDLARLLDEK